MPIDGALLALAVVAGAGGYLVGGVLHAVATRLPAGLPVLGPPACVACAGSPASGGAWLLRPGACSRCGRADRRAAVATQLAAALVSGLAVLRYGVTREAVATALFSLLLLLVLRIDWEHHLIYTVTVVPGIALALMLAALDSSAALFSAVAAGGGAAVSFGLFFALGMLLYRRAALGAGDIMLAGLIGTMTGVRHVLPALFLGMVTAAVVGLLLLALRRRSRTDYLPYGAYLCGGTIVALFLWGPAG